MKTSTINTLKAVVVGIYLFVILMATCTSCGVEPTIAHFQVQAVEGNTVILVNMSTGEPFTFTSNKADSFQVGDDLYWDYFKQNR